ncbi:MAG: hypothetical protein COZ75_10920 [Flavobacteriaceae bacterium CG_4_8_14_3_um_filter_34_10]|nr:hypothetical protein [Flavobacteriia bacterium]OIP50755.1 MAG: hypothetical protein AUK33_06530 [Flavobacteriaceae bacterium CG2_30_34_30]PIQ19384.1 MAG: hypothetical protein COW66_01410 [Flavobacteriaceae bacterium CG18_big_fil_WC_8_21_14_2_50_34_36]PIV50366.1 MAG: hypothetical protein COS19_04115 [Flavobacteriaceae bacterium CG02_land_8_20_14_3_00_34_13]PIX08655.1 MAG: hypothetical protein COZ75_10920 [Flavobacteriaceae bacterium CG_4_8_14_3_um_filter_34_10]PIZ08013.1 MAG: hypothetical pr
MKPKTDNGTTRREFIEQMSLLGMASMLPLSFFSCGKNTPDIDYQGTGLAPYKVWEEMLMAVKTSPDHLKGRMQQLIKSKNPQAMLEFVRDEIHLIPNESNSLREMGKMMITGIPGVLRSGFATPREKAELLNTMLHKGGFDCQVVYEKTDFQPEEVMAFFFKPINRTFEPLVNQAILERWSEELQVSPNKDRQYTIDQNERESKDLANHLFGFLPKEHLNRIHTFDYRWDNNRTPCIKLKNEFDHTYLHLFDPSVTFGTLKEGENGKTSEADPAEFIDKKIQLTLSVASGEQQEHQILQGEWSLHELTGNQVLLHFGNGLSLIQQLKTSIGSLTMFTPSFSLQSYTMTEDAMSDKSFIGKTITLQGDVIDTTDDVVKVNERPIVLAPNNDLQKQVEQLTIKAQPGKYPFLKLEVEPLDANAQQVTQLSASDFKMKINDQPISALMLNNVQTPKIILMYDVSGSMPGDYSGEKIEVFVSQMEKQILDQYPAANIQKWKTPSELYTWLYKASSTSADLIIYATDGDNGDSLKEEWIQTYESGATAVILNVKNSSRPYHLTTFETMAKLTNGIVINAKDQEETIGKIVDYLKDFKIAPYVFTCNTLNKQKENTVSISIDSGRVEASTTFEFKIFPNETSSLSTELSGVYLQINYDKFSVKKTLAGYDPLLHKYRKANHTDYLDVQSLLLGGALIGIEGQGPTFANQMADALQYKLSSRKWGEALLKNQIEEAKTHYENGLFVYDDRLASLMQPLNNQVTDRSLTFASGPRMGIVKNKVSLGTQQSSINFDYLQTSNFVTLAEDPLEAYRINMQKTAQMALMENTLFEEATLSQLKNKPLIEVYAARDISRFAQDLQPNQINYWNEKLYRVRTEFKIFDQNIESKAFWSINRQTGELYGILENDTAGGVERIQKQLNEILLAMDTYLLLLGVMSARSGIPLAIVGGYGKTLVKLYAIASEALVVMDTSGMDEEIKAVLAELACETYKTIVLGMYGNAGTAMGGLEYLIGLMTGKSFCSLKNK